MAITRIETRSPIADWLNNVLPTLALQGARRGRQRSEEIADREERRRYNEE